MRARSHVPLCSVLAVCTAALLGCGDGGDSAATPGVTEAERQLGSALLSPEDRVASSSALSASELPPGDSLDAADAPPSDN